LTKNRKIDTLSILEANKKWLLQLYE